MPRPCVVYVLTCPRSVRYLDETLASLKANGADDLPLVVWDDNPPSGTLNASWGAYRDCKERFPGHDLIVFEDDVITCKNGVTAMARLEVGKAYSFYSFFNTPMRYCEKHLDGIPYSSVDYANSRAARHTPLVPGIYPQRIVGGNFCFAQGIKIPAEHLVKIADFDWKANPFVSKRQWVEKNGRDVTLSYCCKELGLPLAWGVVVPNWIEHIGMRSAVIELHGEHYSAKRPTSANWPGVDHDALLDLEYLK